MIWKKDNGFFDMADSLVETLGLDETNELNLIISKILQEDLTDSVDFFSQELENAIRSLQAIIF